MAVFDLVLILMAAPPNYADAVLNEQPIAYWRFDEAQGSTIAVDRSGNGHDGAYLNVALGATVKPGDTAAKFRGVASKVIIPNHPDLNPSTITLEAVLVLTATSVLQMRVLEKSTESGNTQPLYGIQIYPDRKVVFEYNANDELRSLTSNQTMPLNEVVHLIATFDGSAATLYIDGVVDTSATSLGTLSNRPTEPLAIGNQVTRERPFVGIIDEIAIYAAGLTAATATAHHQALLAPLGGDAGTGDADGSDGDVEEDAGTLDAGSMNSMDSGGRDAGTAGEQDAGTAGEQDASTMVEDAGTRIDPPDEGCDCAATSPSSGPLWLLLLSLMLRPLRTRRRR